MQKLERMGFIEIGSSKFKIGKSLFVEMQKLQPWKGLQELRIPILFVHGDKDTYVPYETSTSFECVDIFRFDENGKIKELTIIYDTSKIRTSFEEMKK
jgi:pimeloyl-ACP methyl ester carboxylesterase